MGLTTDQIDDVLINSRAGDLDELKTFFTEHGAQVLPEIKDEYSLSTALHMGAANGHLEVVDYLVELCKDDKELTRKVLDAQNESGNTPLHWAALNGHLDVVKALCKAGAQPFITNEAKHDVFYEAESNEQEEVIDFLLQEFSLEPEGDDAEEDNENDNGKDDQDEKLAEDVDNLNVKEE